MYKVEIESHIRDRSVWFVLEDLKKEALENLLVHHPVSGICEKVDYIDGAYQGRVMFDKKWRCFVIRIVNEE